MNADGAIGHTCPENSMRHSPFSRQRFPNCVSLEIRPSRTRFSS